MATASRKTQKVVKTSTSLHLITYRSALYYVQLVFYALVIVMGTINAYSYFRPYQYVCADSTHLVPAEPSSGVAQIIIIVVEAGLVFGFIKIKGKYSWIFKVAVF